MVRFWTQPLRPCICKMGLKMYHLVIVRINETLGVSAQLTWGNPERLRKRFLWFLSFFFFCIPLSWHEMALAPDIQVLGSHHCSPGITFCGWQSAKRKFASPWITLLELQPRCDFCLHSSPTTITALQWTQICSRAALVSTTGRRSRGAPTIYSYSKFQIQSLEVLWHKFYSWKSLPGASSGTKKS